MNVKNHKLFRYIWGNHSCLRLSQSFMFIPYQEDDAIFQATHPEPSSGFRGVDESPSTHLELEPQIQYNEQEPVNLSYINPDASMSPEGRREYGL